jgi:hypothetical protein
MVPEFLMNYEMVTAIQDFVYGNNIAKEAEGIWTTYDDYLPFAKKESLTKELEEAMEKRANSENKAKGKTIGPGERRDKPAPARIDEINAEGDVDLDSYNRLYKWESSSAGAAF